MADVREAHSKTPLELSSQALPTERAVESTLLSTFAALSHLQASVPRPLLSVVLLQAGCGRPHQHRSGISGAPTRAVPQARSHSRSGHRRALHNAPQALARHSSSNGHQR
ncbi:hypothetical protein NDU88_007955 [Pleurodeles waltl]|uniref:Uncharacterized protein n=1 Tax=Pleurodeles waltl TaxID=8319 RepID=A0AAV7QM45_PLEWA|nr:hypothetical protein NDU88_007955 [Pleurodeles waltl]